MPQRASNFASRLSRTLSSIALGTVLIEAGSVFAEFRADFDDGGPIRRVDPTGSGGWSWYAGDGQARIDLTQHDGFARMKVDATEDELNIWWAVVRTRVDQGVRKPGSDISSHELRIEARVRVSHAPRRINLQLSSASTRHHEHLREFDIPAADVWHVVSMTSKGFPLRPEEPVYAQVAMMDWGRHIYSTDIDYLRVSLVDAADPPPDLGLPQEYHPPIPPVEELPEHAVAAANALIDELHPNLQLTPWGAGPIGNPQAGLLAVAPGQRALLRWDLSAWRGRKASGVATLELTTHDLTRRLQEDEELGRVRVLEILPTAPDWSEDEVTFNSFTGGGGLDAVVNSQPVIDVLIDPTPGTRNRIALPQTVVQRMLDGRNAGLALQALGPVHATFRALGGESDSDAPALRFRLVSDDPAGSAASPGNHASAGSIR